MSCLWTELTEKWVTNMSIKIVLIFELEQAICACNRQWKLHDLAELRLLASGMPVGGGLERVRICPCAVWGQQTRRVRMYACLLMLFVMRLPSLANDGRLILCLKSEKMAVGTFTPRG